MSVRERGDDEDQQHGDQIEQEIEQAIEQKLDEEGVVTTIPTPHEGDEIANLPIQISIAVPSTQGGQQMNREPFEDRIDDVKRWFSETFGGATTIRASGDYIGEDGELVEEAVAVVEASMSKDTYLDNYQEFGSRIERAQEMWGQQAVYYTVEGRAFIYPERSYLDDGEEVPAELVHIS